MVKTNDYAIWLFAVLLIFLVFGLFSDLGVIKEKQVDKITGRATTANADTTASIANWFSINLSTNLSGSGIVFDIDNLPSYYTNATANYDNVTGGNNESKMFLTVDIDSNVNVDFCIKANESLRAGSNTIALTNYTWANYTNTNVSYPPLAAAKPLINTSFDNCSTSVGKGNSTYYRFWLNVSGDTAAGTYVNQINFKGVQTGNAC